MLDPFCPRVNDNVTLEVVSISSNIEWDIK